MGVTFWGNFASGTLFSSISLARHVLCASGLHKLDFNDACCAGHRNNNTGDLIIILLPSNHTVAGPAEPANQPGLDWIAADPEHDRDGRGRRLRCEPRRLAPAATIAAICCLTCFAPFLI